MAEQKPSPDDGRGPEGIGQPGAEAWRASLEEGKAKLDEAMQEGLSRPRNRPAGALLEVGGAEQVETLDRASEVYEDARSKVERVLEPKKEIVLPSLAAQFQETLVSRLKELIPELPPGPREKAETAVAMNQAMNRAFWQELKDELRPVVKELLREIPPDFAGKQARAALVNKLLESLDLAFVVRDDDGRAHVCSVLAVRAREMDNTGALRLRERSASGTTRRSYQLPPPEAVEVLESPAVEKAERGPAGRGPG